MILAADLYALAQAGDVRAQDLLGYALFNDENADQPERDHGRKWLETAADRGDARAETIVGVMHENGAGYPPDPVEALSWYRRAAAHGDAMAESYIGTAYDSGTGVAADVQEALKWYRMAAAQGLDGAEISLGVHYQYGEGVRRDKAEALRWYRKVADADPALADHNIGTLSKEGLAGRPDYGRPVVRQGRRARRRPWRKRPWPALPGRPRCGAGLRHRPAPLPRGGRPGVRQRHGQHRLYV